MSVPPPECPYHRIMAERAAKAADAAAKKPVVPQLGLKAVNVSSDSSSPTSASAGSGAGGAGAGTSAGSAACTTEVPKGICPFRPKAGSVNPHAPAAAAGASSRGYVSVTQRATAAMRALESEDESPLFVDPYARVLAGSEGFMWPNMLPAAQLEGFKALMATRTKFIDDFIEKSVLGLDGSGVAQVVIVGSGLDSRAYRMFSTSSATVFELDLPEVFVLKNNILKKAEAKTVCGALKQVHADATVEGWDSKLIEAGFDSTKPSVWVLEGFTGYMMEPELHVFLARLKALACTGSVIVSTFVGQSGLPTGSTTSRHSFHKFVTDAGHEMLKRYGWDASQLGIGAIAAKFGRASDALPESDTRYFIATGTRL